MSKHHIGNVRRQVKTFMMLYGLSAPPFYGTRFSPGQAQHLVRRIATSSASNRVNLNSRLESKEKTVQRLLITSSMRKRKNTSVLCTSCYSLFDPVETCLHINDSSLGLFVLVILSIHSSPRAIYLPVETSLIPNITAIY
jgi:hypothetical protein